jgi:hypothetical protein
MKTHLQLIATRLAQLERLRAYLVHATGKIGQCGMLQKSPAEYTLDDSNNLAAFRMRVSEFQEHLGKLLTSIAREEEVEYSGFSDVLAFAEKARIISSESAWKEVREVRNQINHEYEDNPDALTEIVKKMVACIPVLFEWETGARNFCAAKYALGDSPS